MNDPRSEAPSAEVPRSIAQVIFGDNPVRAVVRLVLLSLAVGIILSAMGYTSIELFQDFRRKLEALVKVAEWLVTNSFGIVILGAAVVVPIWAVVRLWGVFMLGKR